MWPTGSGRGTPVAVVCIVDVYRLIQVLLLQANSDLSGTQLIIAVCTWALCSHFYHCDVSKFELFSRR
jgi:hypothetical protein